MNAVGEGARRAGRRLLSSPAAMFVAVLSVGLGGSSAAQHLGLYHAASASARRCTVVLACPRTNAHASNAKTANTPAESTTATAENSGSGTPGQAAWMDKNSGKKPGDGGLTVPLPDFSAPELSRFISPL